MKIRKENLCLGQLFLVVTSFLDVGLVLGTVYLVGLVTERGVYAPILCLQLMMSIPIF